MDFDFNRGSDLSTRLPVDDECADVDFGNDNCSLTEDEYLPGENLPHPTYRYEKNCPLLRPFPFNFPLSFGIHSLCAISAH
jgi:hypothetical protein